MRSYKTVFSITLLHNINPIVRDPQNLVGVAKILIKKRIIEKISYERRAFESIAAYLRLYLKINGK